MMPLRAMAWRPVKHMLSSAFCTVLDYGLYVLLLAVCSPAVSYVGARLCSAAVNYQLSRRVVFHGRPSALSALEYGMLVIVCMVLGSLGVTVLSGLHMGSVPAKLALDSALFVMNYAVQKRLIFAKKTNSPK